VITPVIMFIPQAYFTSPLFGNVVVTAGTGDARAVPTAEVTPPESNLPGI
jgi:hypothetical protein